MAEYRPYRVINASAQTRLTQVKLVAVSGFMLMALLINWRVTQLVARAVRLCASAGTRVVRLLCAVGMDRLVVALALGRSLPADLGIQHPRGRLSLISS